MVSVKGSKGELHQTVDPNITVKMEDTIVLERHSEQKIIKQSMVYTEL